MNQYRIFTVGSCALHYLANADKGAVQGVTSQGIFLRPGQEGIVFLSYSLFRSPTTATLSIPREQMPPADEQVTRAPVITFLSNLVVGSEFSINHVNGSAQALIFPGIDLKLVLNGAVCWQAPSAPLFIGRPPVIQRRLEAFCQRVAAQKRGETGLTPLLAAILGQPPRENLALELQTQWDRILRLKQSLLDADPDAFKKSVQNLLGLGRGLTPSGDDLLTGFLLTLNRFSARLKIPFALDQMNDYIVNAASQKTTSISTTLLKCATQGEADERLVTALDYLFTGREDENRCVEYLLKIGHSSGVDTLAGYALAILTAKQLS